MNDLKKLRIKIERLNLVISDDFEEMGVTSKTKRKL
jgi:hypothetical protein